jgi:hypothetical protein
MKKLLIYCCLLCVVTHSNAQKVIDVDKAGGTANLANYFYTVSGVPFVNVKFARIVEGTPFFNENMMKGAIILSEGKEYKNLLVRINLLDAQVHYIDDKQIEMIAGSPIKEVVLWDTINQKDYRFVFSAYIEATEKPEKGFYELLHAGKAELYKQHEKKLSESRPYGSATVEQRVETITKYFVLCNKQWKQIKKLKDLTGLLNDKSTEISRFVTDNKISGDNEANFEKVIAHYNSLFNQQ